MTIDPQVLRAEQHLEIGRALQGNAAALIEHWSRRAAQEQPHAARAHDQVLRDQLLPFLRALGRSLAESTTESGPHCGLAAEHGEQRWDAGWSLTEVVRDYQILRLVVFEDLEAALQRPLVRREVLAIGLALDEAIAASVASYVRHRDAHTHALDQDLRKQAAELREVDRRKNEFLAILAHELRNPMAPILNAVEVLRLRGPADPNVAQARDIVERQVRQMVRLVDDLADLTRISQGKLELRRRTFDLAAAADEAVQAAAPLFEAQGQTLTVSLPAGPLPLEGDPARVVQVLINLLNNAAKYTDRGGRVHLTACREGGDVVLAIRDNGVGIEPEMLGRIFDLFTQIDRSRARSRGGLGIGLTLVRRLVELHGGRVSVRSDGPGKGSEFVVRLPAADPAPPDAPRPEAAGPATTPLNILIIEDNADARATLQQLLTLLGHRVEAFAGGADGVAAALSGRPHAALVDLGLPDMDGLEAARRLRAGLGASMLLVALTGHASEEDRRNCLQAGFDDHLAKPVDVGALKELLARAAVLQHKLPLV